MQNMLPPDLAAAAPAGAATMSQFCLTLVIEPPAWGPGLNLALAPSARPGMRVCWARPLGGGGNGGSGNGSEGGGCGSAGAGAGEVGAGAAAAQEEAEAGGEGGGGGGGGSRLQWIVASVGVVGHDGPDGHGERGAGTGDWGVGCCKDGTGKGGQAAVHARSEGTGQVRGRMVIRRAGRAC